LIVITWRQHLSVIGKECKCVFCCNFSYKSFNSGKFVILSGLWGEGLVETTQLGDTSKKMIAGLAANTVSFEFHQDFQVGSVESVIYPLLGTATTCRIKPIDAARSTSNPEYIMDGTLGSGRVLISEWTPLNAAAGELTTASVTWPISGDVIKLTTP
jgi:hypothetical protein